MVDVYGTPYIEALHVVERYRLIDEEAAKAAQDRGGIENQRAGGGWTADPNYKGKGFNSTLRSRMKGFSRYPGRPTSRVWAIPLLSFRDFLLRPLPRWRNRRR
jgi:hypothetical protein